MVPFSVNTFGCEIKAIKKYLVVLKNQLNGWVPNEGNEEMSPGAIPDQSICAILSDQHK